MPATKENSLLGLNLQELTALAEETGQPSYRGRQIFEGIYRQGLRSVEDLSPLPRTFRDELLHQGFSIGWPEIEKKFESGDGTVRYLLKLNDGQTVETVWMPEGDDGETGDGTAAGDEEDQRSFRRATICVSSQVGCAVDCQFCLTALLGVKRNLSAGEIVGQIATVVDDQSVSLPENRINIVFMGMGEPFLNYDHFMKAVSLLVEGVGIAESRMTVSTAGIVPRIFDFGAEPVRPKLAISLNASNDELRSRLMPLNKKWDLEMLMQAVRGFPLRNRERITFEYVLLDGINDSPEHAREVIELVRGIRCKVNLIALNPGPGIQFGTPSEQRVQTFKELLMKAGIPAFVRRPRGRDIYAACGQLKRTVA